MLVSQLGIDDVERLLAPLETVFDEWKQHPVFFVGVMEKGTDVTLRVKHRACEPNGLAGLTRRSSTGLHAIMSGIHRVLFDRRPHGPAARGTDRIAGNYCLHPAPNTLPAAHHETRLLWLSKEILRSLRTC